MAKNVSITEDGNSKTIENAARIRTSLIGGGTCDWIPKDDVPLQKLTVAEDGTYRPEQNYYGFSQVTARGIGNVIEGELIEKTITKNGTYNIKDESGNPYGYSKIIVNIDTSGDDSGGDSGGGGGGGITGKDEDGNDTMAETDEDGNIVMTALPTEIKVIIPPTKLEYNRYEEIDYSGISVYAYISKAVHWLGTSATAISEGSTNSTVVVDGKSISVSVGDGVTYSPAPAVTYHLVWDGSKWVKSSNYSAEKAVWKSDKYPTGKIPFEELIFPIKRINNIESEKIVYTFDIDGILFKLVSVNSFSWSVPGYAGDTGEYLGTTFYTINLRGSEYLGVIDMYDPDSRDSKVYVVSNTPNTKSIEYETTRYESYAMDVIAHKTYPKANYTTVHQISAENIRCAHNEYSCSVNIPVTNIPYGKTSSDILNNIINRYNSNDYKKTELISVPVQWKRPGDGKILETTFTAWMKDDGSEAPQGGND